MGEGILRFVTARIQLIIGVNQMICENCGEAEATFHHVIIQENEVIHKHLCDSCAGSAGESADEESSPTEKAFNELQEGQEESEATCPRCGSQLKELRKSGRVGCAMCYEAFRDELNKLIKRIHGTDRHVGRETEKGKLGTMPEEKKIRFLEKELERCVQEENYEEAAEIRDRIAELEEGEKIGATG